jgi:hypothetical protein
VIERIAPFLGVQRRVDTNPFAAPVEVAAADSGEEH